MPDPGHGVGDPPCIPPGDTYGWPAHRPRSRGSCYQHRKASESAVQKWAQVTKVADYRVPPSGSWTSACGETTTGLTPNPDFHAAGIPPYMRKSDAGGSADCPTPVRCGTATGVGETGDCPGVCWGYCDNNTGNPFCNDWWFGDMVAPRDLIGCATPDATHRTIDYNCFEELPGVTVDLSLCRKIGFKNVQGQKWWHGRYGYKTPDQTGTVGSPFAGWADILRSLTDCDHGDCSDCMCDVMLERATAPGVKYLKEAQTLTITQEAEDGSHTRTASRSCDIGRYTGLCSFGCSYPSNPQFDIYSGQAVYLLNNDMTNFARVSVMNLAGWFKTIVNGVAAFPFSPSCSGVPTDGSVAACYDIAYSGTSVEFTQMVAHSYDGGATFVFELINHATLDLAAGDFAWQQYDFDDGGSWVQKVDRHAHVTDTSFHEWETLGYYTSGGFHGNTTYDFQADLDPTRAYTSEDVVNDVYAALNKWDLTNDIVYPYRTDGLLTVAPIVSYKERGPAQGIQWGCEIVVDPADGTNSFTLTDIDGQTWVLVAGVYTLTGTPASTFYDGSFLGAPLDIPGVDMGFFDWRHKTWKRCADLSGPDAYFFGYGSQAGSQGTGDFSTGDFTDQVMPLCATRWSENWPNPGLDFPFAWIRHDGGLCRAQKWAEIKIPRPGYNFDRPCGNDRYVFDESTVQCVQSVTGSGPYVLTLLAAISGLAINDYGYVCSVSGVPDGVYKVTAISGATVTVTVQSWTPNTSASVINCGTGIFGKLRWNSNLADCSGSWNDDRSKGRFAYIEWQQDHRDWQEKNRLNYQHTTRCGGCSEAPTATGLRETQASHGMPQSVKTFIVEQHCLPFTVCDPQVMAISPNGEVFANGITKAFPAANSFTLDEYAGFDDGISGAGPTGYTWQAQWIQHMVDPLWQAPHRPCVQGCNDKHPTLCAWTEDGGCLGCCIHDCVELCDDLEDPPVDAAAGTLFYAHRPYCEMILEVPVGAPSLPAGITLHVLTLAELAMVSPPSGKLIPPPDPPGYPDEDGSYGGKDPTQPNSIDTPWTIYGREMLCTCDGGEFAADYEAQGVKVRCP